MSGRLGGFSLAASTWTKIHEAGTGNDATVALILTNTNADAATNPVYVRVAIKENNVGDPTAVDIIEYDWPVYNESLRIEGIPLTAGQCVYAYAGATGITAVAYGVEEASQLAAFGRLGGADLTATTWAKVHECGTGNIATVTLVMTNRNTDAAQDPTYVRIAVKENNVGDPTSVDLIEYDWPVKNRALRIEGIVLGAGQCVYAYAGAANVTAVAYGIEEAV